MGRLLLSLLSFLLVCAYVCILVGHNFSFAAATFDASCAPTAIIVDVSALRTLSRSQDWLQYYNVEPTDFPGTDDQKKLVMVRAWRAA